MLVPVWEVGELIWFHFDITIQHSICGDYFTGWAQVWKHILAMLQAEVLFSSNVHFYTSYILSVNYVLPQTRACKNFENRMNTKKVIDIHDYDFTLKDLVGYNKLVWSVGDLFPGPEIILLAWTKCENTSLPCFRQRYFFSANAYFYTCYSLFVIYVLPRTRACKNFENLINTKKVIDIYDYDYTINASGHLVSNGHYRVKR